MLCDLPWLLRDFVPIALIRTGMAAVCLAFGWFTTFCRTKGQREWLIAAGALVLTAGFAVIGHREGSYYSFTLAIFQMMAFVMLFLPLRRTAFGLTAAAVGLLWFGTGMYTGEDVSNRGILLGQAVGYVLFCFMLTAGLMWYDRIRATDQERKINLVQRARQLEAQTEELIRDNERKFEMLIKLSPDPTFLHDGDTIHYANEAFMQLANVSSLDVIKGVSLQLFTHPDDWEKAQDYYETASKEEALKFLQYSFVKWGGESIEVEACSIALTHHMLDRHLTQTVLRDLTTLKLVEERLGRSDRMSALGQMAAGFAHEIRNPLTSLKGFIQLLRKKAPDHGNYYDIMTNELDRIHSIVNDFMMIAKPRQVEFKEQDLRELLNHVYTLLESSAYCNQIRLENELEPELPSILGDGDQLKQVFINLIKNAFEAMPSGGEVRIRATRQAGRAVVQIIDQGVGIPEDKLPKLGEPFFTTKENGTGLGLHVCYRIIESHKGHMSIRSKVNEGTTVEIVLPSA